MAKSAGGVVGKQITPSTGAASGVWNLREQINARVGATWPSLSLGIDYLIVAGGGGGGGRVGGGGGGGGVKTGTANIAPATTLSITVGSGGSGASGGNAPASGSASSVIGGTLSESASGGGRGGVYQFHNAASGGSGGGGAGFANQSGASGTSGQGNAGGNGDTAGGGGGGAGNVGGNSAGGAGGNGGAAGTSGGGAGGAASSKYAISPWLTTTADNVSPGAFSPSGVDHLGCYWYLDQLIAGGYQYAIEVEVQFQFKKPLINNVSSVAAIPARLAVLNDSADGIVGGGDGI